jgi:hypothetical protein
MKHCQLVCAFLFLIVSWSVVQAQIAADLRGRVIDPSGAGVTRADVELTNSETNLRLTTTTTSSGDYVFTNLNPGSYQIDVTAPGFEHLTRTRVTAIMGQTVTVDLSLRVGGGQQTVKVTDEAPPLQTATSNIETNIGGSTVIAIPLNTRNFVQLATLAPGVELPPGTLLPRINGSGQSTNEYVYDLISARCSLSGGRLHSCRAWRTARN